MVFSGFVLIAVFVGLREFFPIPKFFAILMLILMVAGAFRMSIQSAFGKNDLAESDDDSPELSDKQVADKSLPEVEYRPPLDFETTNFDTNELATPPSVTENTTKLLKKELPQK
jgi:hypothetical protein